MFDLILCGFSLSCQINNIKYYFNTSKYPPDVADICRYFEEQKTELPEYCKWKSEIQPPRKRSEF